MGITYRRKLLEIKELTGWTDEKIGELLGMSKYTVQSQRYGRRRIVNPNEKRKITTTYKHVVRWKQQKKEARKIEKKKEELKVVNIVSLEEQKHSGYAIALYNEIPAKTGEKLRDTVGRYIDEEEKADMVVIDYESSKRFNRRLTNKQQVRGIHYLESVGIMFLYESYENLRRMVERNTERKNERKKLLELLDEIYGKLSEGIL